MAETPLSCGTVFLATLIVCINCLFCRDTSTFRNECPNIRHYRLLNLRLNIQIVVRANWPYQNFQTNVWRFFCETYSILIFFPHDTRWIFILSSRKLFYVDFLFLEHVAYLFFILAKLVLPYSFLGMKLVARWFYFPETCFMLITSS